MNDTDRLDWLQRIMTPADDYVEVYLAGLRHAGKDATAFQFETNPMTFVNQAHSLREVIDQAMAKQPLAKVPSKMLERWTAACLDPE